MSTVFRGRDTRLVRDVAIKVLRLDSKRTADARIAYVNEARVLSYLSHPGVPPIYDCGTTCNGMPYHVMKLLRGQTLGQILLAGNCTPARLLGIFADVAQTMAFAHSRCVIHLDLKPDNIMVGAFREVYVMDWGLARFESTAPPESGGLPDDFGTDAGRYPIAGTPAYMSPEQARGESLDPRADVFELGGLLCEILIGQAPYSGENVEQVHRRALNASVGDLLDVLEVCDTDRALVRLVNRCLAPHRRNRPRDATEVADAVSAYQDTALQRAESDMNRFFELSLDLFCIADIEGYFRRINSNFSRILGYSDHELLARSFMDFIHPDDIQQTMATMATMAALDEGQSVVRFNNRYRTAHGRYVVLEWTAKAVPNENVIFAVARDIT
jgi:eukaryotic-like serine/threonine-protein kinase